MKPKPLCVDLYCGLGGWAEGFLSEGYRVKGFDIEAHDYGTGGYPGELILRDVRSIHGSEFKDAAVIVGFSPCQEFSYRAMPWKRAKALPPPYLGIELFQAQFRIQREANEVAGCLCGHSAERHGSNWEGECPAKDCTGFPICYEAKCGCREFCRRYIPMVVENVRGAQKWVGRARWHFGSYYLWGDVPALMPPVIAHKVSGFRFDGVSHGSFQSAAVKTVGHVNIRDGHTHARHLTNQRESDALKWGDCHGKRFDARPKGNVAAHREGTKCSGVNLSEVGFNVAAARSVDVRNKPEDFKQTAEMKRQHIGYSRKAASALIAKIPFPLAQHIARCFKPALVEESA